MNTNDNGLTILALIDKMRDCRKKQSAFRKQKNTENYKAMLTAEEETDELLKNVRAYISYQAEERNIEVMPCQANLSERRRGR